MGGVQLARGGAEPNAGITLSTREIAEREGLSLEYTAQILTSMRKAGLVTSVRGVNGGFRLARAATAIRRLASLKLHCKSLIPGRPSFTLEADPETLIIPHSHSLFPIPYSSKPGFW